MGLYNTEKNVFWGRLNRGSTIFIDLWMGRMRDRNELRGKEFQAREIGLSKSPEAVRWEMVKKLWINQYE